LDGANWESLDHTRSREKERGGHQPKKGRTKAAIERDWQIHFLRLDIEDVARTGRGGQAGMRKQIKTKSC